MWDWLGPALAAVGAAVVAALGGAAVGRRQRSGRVQTSEASDLWKESSTLRQELYKQASELRALLDQSREEIFTLQEALVAMRLAHAECKRQIGELMERLSVLQQREEERHD